jgi:predicted Rossmann fold flavoprotein
MRNNVGQFDVVILGAGAAGLFCAGLLAQAGLTVAVVEHNNKPGKKIRISGGGRCNFTNIHTTHRNFISRNPDFARSALARYGPNDFIALVERYQISWHEKTLGQLFCDGSSQQIIDMLVHECLVAGGLNGEVRFYYSTHVEDVHRPDQFEVRTTSDTLRCHHLVVATGGLSIPTLGASDLAYRLARQFHIPVVETAPALVPLVGDASWVNDWGQLSGVSLPVHATCNGSSFQESMLITHRGLSGPSILQVSSYWSKGDAVTIDTLRSVDDDELADRLCRDKRLLRNAMADHVPARFIDNWKDDRLQRPGTEIRKREILEILEQLHHWTFMPAGTEGYAKAEVTRGGVDTDALSSKTMESKTVSGLYFIGEAVDVTGWLGGYNFQWAWSSAYAAAQELILRRPV